jgi:hypothetical protein
MKPKVSHCASHCTGTPTLRQVAETAAGSRRTPPTRSCPNPWPSPPAHRRNRRPRLGQLREALTCTGSESTRRPMAPPPPHLHRESSRPTHDRRSHPESGPATAGQPTTPRTPPAKVRSSGRAGRRADGGSCGNVEVRALATQGEVDPRVTFVLGVHVIQHVEKGLALPQSRTPVIALLRCAAGSGTVSNAVR